jgi:hypothetical protein
MTRSELEAMIEEMVADYMPKVNKSERTLFTEALADELCVAFDVSDDGVLPLDLDSDF